jgi:hypothetical protein
MLNQLCPKVPSAIGSIDLKVRVQDGDCNSASYGVTITVLDQAGGHYDVVSAMLPDIVSKARVNQVRACLREIWKAAEAGLLPERG